MTTSNISLDVAMFTRPFATKAKIKIARVLYRLVRVFRLAQGKNGDTIVCRRQGITWELDLSQGIDLSIYLFGRFEKATSQALQRTIKPGMIVFDIGANMGAHALPLAKAVGPHGKVYAFEPTNWAFSRLAKNASLNPDIAKRLHTMQVGLTNDKEQKIQKEFYASWSLLDPSQNQHGTHGGTLCSASDARFITMDEACSQLGLAKLDAIKLDVDGYESFILKGGIKTLKHFKPIIFMELCPYVQKENASSLTEIIEILMGAGYLFFDEITKNPLPEEAVEIEKLIPANGSINVIAMPV